MSTIERQKPPVLPPLVAGQRLDQPTFHARYEAMPPETRAELVGGIVYMPSPLRDDHGEFDSDVAGWLFHYKMRTPGVRSPLNATVKLGGLYEPQPDAQLRIPIEMGGQTHIDESGYITGAPELVVEIGRASRAFDLGDKKADYERAGVLEYVFVGLEPEGVRWFVLHDEHFEDMPPGPGGIFRSTVFAGLWLDPAALYAGEREHLIAVLDQGLAKPEHAAFAARLVGTRRGCGP